MYDYSKLRGRIIEKYHSVSKFAEKSSMSRVWIYNILKGRAKMSQTIITEFADLLEIEPADYYSYFFNLKNRQSE